MNSHANALTWYENKALQNHRQHWFFNNAVPVVSEFDRIPPFQVSKQQGSGQVNQLLLIPIDESEEINILVNCQSAGLDLIQADDWDVISYPDTIPLSINGLVEGLYFLQMSDGTNTWYSEVFQFCRHVEGMIKIEYWHRENFCHNEGEFVFEFPYKNKVYIRSDIGRPTYHYDERVVSNNGYNYTIQQISFKQYTFTAILTEPVIDALRLIGLHDDVVIYYNNRTYVVNEFLMTNPNWDDRGDVAEVVFEFKTNTVVSISGRATDTQEYTSDPGSCLTLTHNCVALVNASSPEYTAYQYTNSLGGTEDLEDGDKIVKLSGGGIYTVEEYNSNSYTALVVVAGDVVYTANNDQYYGGSGGNTVFIPAIQFYNVDTNVFAASALQGAIHSVFQLIDGQESLIGIYSYNDIVVDGVSFETASQATHLRMKIGSAACGIFFTSADFEIPESNIVLYPSVYIDDNSAGAGGVLECGLYRIAQNNSYGIISPGGKVLAYRQGSCSSYANDAAAAAADVGVGETYQSTLLNDYAVPSGGGRIALIRTDGGSIDTFKGPFASDSEAELNGVLLFEPYQASVSNIYGVPVGGGRVLIVRTS